MNKLNEFIKKYKEGFTVLLVCINATLLFYTISYFNVDLSYHWKIGDNSMITSLNPIKPIKILDTLYGYEIGDTVESAFEITRYCYTEVDENNIEHYIFSFEEIIIPDTLYVKSGDKVYSRILIYRRKGSFNEL